MSKLYNSVAFSLPQVATPDPFQKATYGRDYVDFGLDNLYPQYLADIKNISPTHSAILDAKIALLNASVVIDENLDLKIDLEDVDGEGGTLEDLLDGVFSDLGTYEGAYIEAIYNKPRTRIVTLKVIPYENVRVGRYNEEGDIDTVYISPDWSRKYTKRNKPKPLAVFNTDRADTSSQVIILRLRYPNQPYYTVPSWTAAIQWMLLEDDVAEYTRNQIVSGFTPSTIFNFHNGEPDEDDKAQLEMYLKSKFTGKNSTKFMMFFDNAAANAEGSVDITQLDVPDLAQYWSALSPIVSDKIFTGHRIYPSLVGVPVQNGFSSNAEELNTQFKMYTKTAIKPLQKLVIKMLRRVFKFNTGENVEVTFENELIREEQVVDTTEVNTEDNSTDANINKEGGQDAI